MRSWLETRDAHRIREKMNRITKCYGGNKLSHIYDVEELECVSMRYFILHKWSRLE